VKLGIFPRDHFDQRFLDHPARIFAGLLSADQDQDSCKQREQSHDLVRDNKAHDQW